MSKSALARMLGANPRSMYHWIETGQLDRELERSPLATVRGRRCPRSWTPKSRSLSPGSRRIPSSSAECATVNAETGKFSAAIDKGFEGGTWRIPVV